MNPKPNILNLMDIHCKPVHAIAFTVPRSESWGFLVLKIKDLKFLRNMEISTIKYLKFFRKLNFLLKQYTFPNPKIGYIIHQM
jgi:hypothetical protein